MESRLSSLSKEHTQVTSNLREGIECRAADYDTQIAKLREESTVALLKQKEMQSLNQALSAEERAKIQEQLQRTYDEKLAAAEEEKALFRSKFEADLVKLQEEHKQSQLALQEQIAQLEFKLQKKEKKAALAKMYLDNNSISDNLQNDIQKLVDGKVVSDKDSLTVPGSSGVDVGFLFKEMENLQVSHAEEAKRSRDSQKATFQYVKWCSCR